MQMVLEKTRVGGTQDCIENICRIIKRLPILEKTQWTKGEKSVNLENPGKW